MKELSGLLISSDALGLLISPGLSFKIWWFRLREIHHRKPKTYSLSPVGHCGFSMLAKTVTGGIPEISSWLTPAPATRRKSMSACLLAAGRDHVTTIYCS